MPNSACRSRWPNEAFERSPQRAESRMAFAASRVLARIGDAFVELHRDVRAEKVGLDLDGAFGRQEVRRAVDVRAELDALLLHLAQVGEREDLIAAAVGEDRMRPAHEAVQAAEAMHPLGRGPQHQVVGVAEDDVGSCRPHLVEIERLHRAGRAHRHEGGRCDVAARGRETSECGLHRRWRGCGRGTQPSGFLEAAGRRRHRRRSDSVPSPHGHRRVSSCRAPSWRSPA